MRYVHCTMLTTWYNKLRSLASDVPHCDYGQSLTEVTGFLETILRMDTTLLRLLPDTMVTAAAMTNDEEESAGNCKNSFEKLWKIPDSSAWPEIWHRTWRPLSACRRSFLSLHMHTESDCHNPQASLRGHCVVQLSHAAWVTPEWILKPAERPHPRPENDELTAYDIWCARAVILPSEEKKLQETLTTR